MSIKQDKLKMMWNDLPTMKKDDLLRELQIMNVKMSYEEIVEHLSKTYDDLQVADLIFSKYEVNDTNSKYPKEFVDEAITKIARNEQFSFTHYGVLSQDLLALQNAMMSDQARLMKMQEIFTKFLQLCKKFQLDNFDALVYSINDTLDMGKEFLRFLQLLQNTNEKESYHELIRISDRFLQTFPLMNPWLEEQISYAQATAYIALKSTRGEKMFQTMMKDYPDISEVIYRYGYAYYKLDEKKMNAIFTRYHHDLSKDSEFCMKIQKLARSKQKDLK